MKKQDDFFATYSWCRDVKTDPYDVIVESFTYGGIQFFRKIIRDALLACCSEKIYRKGAPSELLLEFGIVQSIVNAAYVLNQETNDRPSNIGDNDLFNRNLYCSGNTIASDWECFPRSLSKKEFINPYLVFKKFFKYQDLTKWQHDLQDILSGALSEYDLSHESENINFILTYIHLTKVVEAAHLIDVRTTRNAGESIKRKF